MRTLLIVLMARTVFPQNQTELPVDLVRHALNFNTHLDHEVFEQNLRCPLLNLDYSGSNYRIENFIKSWEHCCKLVKTLLIQSWIYVPRMSTFQGICALGRGFVWPGLTQGWTVDASSKEPFQFSYKDVRKRALSVGPQTVAMVSILLSTYQLVKILMSGW